MAPREDEVRHIPSPVWGLRFANVCIGTMLFERGTGWHHAVCGIYWFVFAFALPTGVCIDFVVWFSPKTVLAWSTVL